jgi:Domain of Unknown Function with PDB structure (DUF3857)/Transglutaminase-like superfamily
MKFLSKIKNALVLVVLILLLPALLWAQNHPEYAVSLIPKALLENAHTVVRQELYQIDIPSYDEIIITHKKVVTLLNNNSGAGEFYQDYDDFTKIVKMEARIYDENGSEVREIKKKEIDDYSAVSGGTMYGDSRIKHINLSHPTYPYTVALEYKITISRFMYYPIWQIQNYGVSVQEATFVVTTNDVDNLNYQVLNMELSPTIQLQGEQTTLTWKVDNKTAIGKVAYSPSAAKTLPILLLSPKQFRLGKYEGRMDTWKDFGNFMNKLNHGRDILSQEEAKKIQALTTDAKTDREKAEILYKYLKENTRYISVQIGVGGWQTFEADYVAKNKYGDCKALTHYMKAMLTAVGVKSYPVLINRGDDDPGLIQDDFVLPSFNHVLLKLASEDYFLECTNSYEPPNYLGTGNQNRKALLITESGGELIMTPAILPQDNKEFNKATISLAENGDAHITNECRISGILQDRLRWESFNKKQEELEKYFIENCGLPSPYIKKYSVKPLLEKPEVEVNYEADVRKYAAKSGPRFFVPINPINPFTTVPDNKVRNGKIEFDQGYMLEDELTLILPQGYEVESMPDANTLLESPYGTFKMELITEPTQLVYKRSLTMLPVSLPASAYEDFRNFRKQVAEWDGVKLVLVKKRT